MLITHSFLHLLLNWLIFYCLLFQEKILFGGYFARNSYLITVKIYRSHMNITTTIKSKIFGFLFRNLLQSSDIFSSLRKSSEIIGNCRKMAEIPWYTKQNNLAFLPPIFFFLGKNLMLQWIFFLLLNKCQNAWNLTVSGYRAKKISVNEVPPFRPSFFGVSCRWHLELHQVWIKAESLLFVLK